MELVWPEARFPCYFKSSPGDFNVQPALRTAGLLCRFFLFVFPLGPDQWSSNLSVHQDHLESVSKHMRLAPRSEFLIQQVYYGRVCLRIGVSNKFPCAEAAGMRATFGELLIL